MDCKQQRTQTKPRGKLLLSAMSLSALLALSACSGDNTAAEEPAAVNETETVVVEAPEAETEVVIDEPVAEPEPEEAVVVEAEETAVEPEPVAAEPVVLSADTGAKIYEANCKLCHESGLLSAPIHGDKAAWAPRLTKDKETLYMHSAKGFNKMPAQATDKVSEAEVHAAVDYMLAAVS
ncbi:c-type cytochrome [Psychrobacter fulvigenes]|uniref:c-type cytochrome n=1 Tax=Psychrobacter fulvigenes TaxID=533323 RepID=UPI001918E4BA|nr:c-type cytochrome [Psychrobacter fulvigenes]